MKRTSDRLVVRQVDKEKMVVGNVDSRVAREVSVDGCTTSQANGVMNKIIIPGCEVENQEINVTDGVNHGKGDDGDATEDPSGNSSSFDDTFSGDDSFLGLIDDEINSEFMSPWPFLEFEEPFIKRKKKLTSHWRNFIRPVMWRCKWAELRMKMFQSQASMYSKILAQYDQDGLNQLENFSAECQCSRSLPFPPQMKPNKIMQRKKRKRVEDTTDIASYMQQHNLFAYCENKGILMDKAQRINGNANPEGPAARNSGITLTDNDYLLQLESEETSFERVLAKINSMQSLVHSMTTRVDKVISQNPGKFSSLNQLSVLAPCDSGASTAQDPVTASCDIEKILVTSPCVTTQPASDIRSDNCIVPTSSVAAEQLEDPLPDNSEIAGQPVTANESDNAVDEVPLNKRRIKDDPIVYKKGMLSAKKRRIPSENQPNNTSSNIQTHNDKLDDFLASRLSSLRNNQRKRSKTTRACSGRKQSKRPNLALPS